MMPTEDGVAPPWNRTNPSPATPGVLTARCYAILHHLANIKTLRVLENEKFFELKSREYRDGIKRKETR